MPGQFTLFAARQRHNAPDLGVDTLLAHSPVVRAAAARNLFLATVVITALMSVAIPELGASRASSGFTPIFYHLFVILDFQGAVCALLILICAVLIPSRPWSTTLVRWIGEHPGPLAVGSGALMCAGTLLVYQNHPLSMDEYAVLFQSKIFAAGHLSGQFPAPLLDWLLPHGFRTLFFNVSDQTGRIVTAYWPSFAIVLAPFTALGIPWACNPLISALTVLAIHRLTFRLLESVEAAGLAVLLTVASPVFFADGISYYSMQAHLLANTVYAVLLIQPTARRAFLAGIVGSIALTLHNPVPHLLFAIPWLIWIVRRSGNARLLGWLILGYLPLCLLLGAGWFIFAAHLMHDGIGHATTQAAGPTLLERITWPFTLPSSKIAFARISAAAKVWLWAVPGLVVLAALGAWKHRDDSRYRTLVASALLTFAGYLFVWSDQGHGWGFRFFHSAWLVLPVLAASAVSRRRSTPDHDQGLEGSELRAFIVTTALLTVTVGLGFRAVQMREFILDQLRQVPAYAGTERRVIFIDPTLSFYGVDLVQNDPWLRGDVIRMLARGKADDEAMMRDHFPEMHRVYSDVHGTVWSSK